MSRYRARSLARSIAAAARQIRRTLLWANVTAAVIQPLLWLTLVTSAVFVIRYARRRRGELRTRAPLHDPIPTEGERMADGRDGNELQVGSAY